MGAPAPNPFREWLAARTLGAHGATEVQAALYDDYARWMKAKGYTLVMTQHNFGEALSGVGADRAGTNAKGLVLRRGLRLRPAVEPAPQPTHDDRDLELRPTATFILFVVLSVGLLLAGVAIGLVMAWRGATVAVWATELILLASGTITLGASPPALRLIGHTGLAWAATVLGAVSLLMAAAIFVAGVR